MTQPTMTVPKPGPHPTPDSAQYWDAASEGRLLLQRCEHCSRWQHYPRAFCAACWDTALSWQEPAGTGTVWTVTVAHRPGHPAWSAEAPYAIAIVELSEGPRMLGNVTGCPPEAVFVGMPVHAVFEPRDGYTAVQFEPTENVSHQVREGGAA